MPREAIILSYNTRICNIHYFLYYLRNLTNKIFIARSRNLFWMFYYTSFMKFLVISS